MIQIRMEEELLLHFYSFFRFGPIFQPFPFKNCGVTNPIDTVVLRP